MLNVVKDVDDNATGFDVAIVETNPPLLLTTCNVKEISAVALIALANKFNVYMPPGTGCVNVKLVKNV